MSRCPRCAAAILPRPSRLPASIARVRSGEKKVPHDAHGEDDKCQEHQHLWCVVVEKERDRRCQVAIRLDGEQGHQRLCERQ